jgi:aminomethyltransferase
LVTNSLTFNRSDKLGGVDQPVKRTPLRETHQRLGARMTQFGGFEMPLQYRGIIAEHRAVRSAAGLFDLSHMGEFQLEGPGAADLLEKALTNSVSQLAESQAQYTIMCAEDGCTIDDLIVYRLPSGRYLLCVNAANTEADWSQLKSVSGGGAELVNISEETSLLAIQGPRAAEILGIVCRPDVRGLRRFHSAQAETAGVDSLIARTGYTGEDGFEIFVDAARGSSVFERLLEAGGPSGLLPCGLGARDTLRMEAGLPLYGHELDRKTTPLEAGLGAFVKFGHGFVGESALAMQRDKGPPRRLIGIQTDDGRSIARQGYPILKDREPVGVVTSGTFAPTFERPLAIGYVSSAEKIESGQSLQVAIRRQSVNATVTPLPFYKRTGKTR